MKLYRRIKNIGKTVVEKLSCAYASQPLESLVYTAASENDQSSREDGSELEKRASSNNPNNEKDLTRAAAAVLGGLYGVAALPAMVFGIGFIEISPRPAILAPFLPTITTAGYLGGGLSLINEGLAPIGLLLNIPFWAGLGAGFVYAKRKLNEPKHKGKKLPFYTGILGGLYGLYSAFVDEFLYEYPHEPPITTPFYLGIKTNDIFPFEMHDGGPNLVLWAGIGVTLGYITKGIYTSIKKGGRKMKRAK